MGIPSHSIIFPFLKRLWFFFITDNITIFDFIIYQDNIFGIPPDSFYTTKWNKDGNLPFCTKHLNSSPQIFHPTKYLWNIQRTFKKTFIKQVASYTRCGNFFFMLDFYLHCFKNYNIVGLGTSYIKTFTDVLLKGTSTVSTSCAQNVLW